MKKTILLSIALMCIVTISKAQTTALQFAGLDCNGSSVDLFADLDAGKAVILHFYMPNCGSCPPSAKKILAMANNINANNPGMVKGYAFPFQNSTTCSYSSSWVTSNGLSPFYAPMSNGAAPVAHYGGFGMPTVVLLGGSNHRVMFSSLSFDNSDITVMRDSIINLLKVTTGITDLPISVSAFNVYPNPATDVVSVNVELKEPSNMLIDITDITGKQIAIISNEKQSIGTFTKQFNTEILPSGNYLIRLNVNGKTVTQQINITH